MREISLQPIPLNSLIRYYAGEGKILTAPTWEYHDLVVNLELAEHRRHSRHSKPPIARRRILRTEIDGERLQAIFVTVVCYACQPVPKTKTRVPDVFWNLRLATQDLPNERY